MKKLSLVLLSSVGLFLAYSNVIASEEAPETVASPAYDFNAALSRERSSPDQPFNDFLQERTQLFKREKEASEKKESKPVEKVNPATGIWYQPTRWNKQSWQCTTWVPEDFVVEEETDLEQRRKDAIALLATLTQAPQSEAEVKHSALQAGHAEFFLKYSESFAEKQTAEQIQFAANYALLITQNPKSPYYKTPEEENKTEDPNKITFDQDSQNGYTEYFVEGEKVDDSSCSIM